MSSNKKNVPGNKTVFGIQRGEMAFIVAIALGLIIGMLIKKVRFGILVGLVIGLIIVFLNNFRVKK